MISGIGPLSAETKMIELCIAELFMVERDGLFRGGLPQTGITMILPSASMQGARGNAGMRDAIIYSG